MNEKIKKALICFLNEEIVVSSWGLTNTSIKKSSIEFDVTGFLYQGKIKVIPLESGYRVIFGKKYTLECSLTELVQKIDSIVEKTDNYEADVRDWIIHN